MQETAVENPYGLGALIQNGNIVSRSILAILLIMSLLTWFIMITKFFDQRRRACWRSRRKRNSGPLPA